MHGVGVVLRVQRRVDEGDGVHRGRPSSRSTPAACTAGCGCGPGRWHDVSRVLRERACPPGSVSRPGRQRPPALLLMIFAVCVLHCPPTGADMHRVVSSPDLASMARQSWGGSACHLPAEHKDRLTETPEMRLKKHLDALKAAAAEHGFDTWMHDKTLVAGTKPSHTSNAKPTMELPPATAKGNCPRRRLFDDERFSTVTPEPSDSMSGAPYPRSSSASARRLAPSGVDAFHAKGNGLLRQAVFSTSANNEAAQDLEEYLHVERSIAVGKPASKTSVICFDFDRTLSKDHVHQMTQLSRTGLTTQEAVAAFGGHRRIQHLAAFLSELEACGAAIHIISLGHKSEISDSLRRVGLDHLFTPDRIIGCDELRNLRLVTKAQCIAYVASLYGLQRSDALLVDDDHEQLLECSESTETDLPPSCGSAHNLAAADGGTCGTYWVRSGRGLTERDMAAIGGMARTRKQAAIPNTL